MKLPMLESLVVLSRLFPYNNLGPELYGHLLQSRYVLVTKSRMAALHLLWSSFSLFIRPLAFFRLLSFGGLMLFAEQAAGP
jgi:hypothetical protein